MLKLRPHHLLCMQFFEGFGYSDDFVGHMTGLLAEFAENPSTKVTLRPDCDELCGHCPHNVDGICESGQKVLDYDLKVLEICQLEVGKVYEIGKIRDVAKEKIVSAGRLGEVCVNCSWLEICNK